MQEEIGKKESDRIRWLDNHLCVSLSKNSGVIDGQAWRTYKNNGVASAGHMCVH